MPSRVLVRDWYCWHAWRLRLAGLLTAAPCFMPVNTSTLWWCKECPTVELLSSQEFMFWWSGIKACGGAINIEKLHTWFSQEMITEEVYVADTVVIIVDIQPLSKYGYFATTVELWYQRSRTVVFVQRSAENVLSSCHMTHAGLHVMCSLRARFLQNIWFWATQTVHHVFWHDLEQDLKRECDQDYFWFQVLVAIANANLIFGFEDYQDVFVMCSPCFQTTAFSCCFCRCSAFDIMRAWDDECIIWPQLVDHVWFNIPGWHEPITSTFNHALRTTGFCPCPKYYILADFIVCSAVARGLSLVLVCSLTGKFIMCVCVQQL